MVEGPANRNLLIIKLILLLLGGVVLIVSERSCVLLGALNVLRNLLERNWGSKVLGRVLSSFVPSFALILSF